MGYPDLIFTPWMMGRREPLKVYGPPGIKAMTDAIMRAWQVDVQARTDRLSNREGGQTIVTEFVPGTVYADANVSVTAFPVQHHEMKDSFGFRFETMDRTIVISGDTTPTQALIEHASGCDLLIHEAYSMASYKRVTPSWQRFRRSHHTSSEELAAIANEVRPRLLALYHCSNAGDTTENGTEVLDEIRAMYRGEVVSARDLDVI